MEKTDLIVAEMRNQHETMKFGIEEPRSGGDGVREEMQTVLNSTADIVQENIEDETRGELQRPTQRRTFKEIVANLRDKRETLPWKRKCYYCKGEHRTSECPQRPRRKLKCYFCNGEHRYIECTQRPRRIFEEEWSDSDSDSDSEEEEEDEEIGSIQDSMKGSEQYPVGTTRMEESPAMEGVEKGIGEGPIIGGAVPRETQLVLVEDQDFMDEKPRRELGPTREKVVPKEVPPMLEMFQIAIPDRRPNQREYKAEMEAGGYASALGAYWISYLELEELQGRSNDPCQVTSSRAKATIQTEFGKERKRTPLQVWNFHEEKT